MMKIKKNNYVYQITYSTGIHYIGVRSCDCSIEKDPYMGSAFHIPEKVKLSGIKQILSTHSTREEALLEEIRLHALYDVRNNPKYYNQCNSNSTKFYCGTEGQIRGANKLRGRTKETHPGPAKQAKAMRKYKGKENRTPAQLRRDSDRELIEQCNVKRRALSGDNQTEAQKAGNKRMGEWNKGRKNPKKSNPGLTHGRAKAWSYTDPEGNTQEVHDSIRRFFLEDPRAELLPFGKYVVENHLRNGTQPTTKKTHPAKNWTFEHI